MNPDFSSLLEDWRNLLRSWARSGEFVLAAQRAVRLPDAPAPLLQLNQRLLDAEFSDLPAVQLLPASAMAGAAGAYARSTGTIVLNQEWLASASRDQALAVLTEELGHHLDALLNSSDTPGDEGELFAALLSEAEPLSDERRQRLLADNDQGSIGLNGHELAVEQAAQLLSTPIRPASPGRSSGEFRNQFNFAALKADGSVVSFGPLGHSYNTSVVAGQLSSWVSQIFSTADAFAALKADGSVVTWGNDFYGGDSCTVASRLRSGVSQVFSTEQAFAALKADGSVVSWGAPAYTYSNAGGDSSLVANQLSSGVSQIFPSDDAFAALKVDGSVVTWGSNFSGGNSSTVASQLSSGVQQIFTAAGAFAALKSDGSVVTWGNSYYSYINKGGDSSAVADQLSSGVSQIVSSRDAFAALKADGSVVSWGGSGGDSSAVAS
ncbi:MAG: RCC1 domain-containing protein [Synechococcaceae cyanobacterium]